MTEAQAIAIVDDMLEVGHFLFEQASWDFYEYILEQRDELGFYARITYDRGLMEVLSGAGIEPTFEGRLVQFVREFDFDGDEAARASTDLVPKDDIMYVVAMTPSPDARTPREVLIHVSRVTLVPREGDLEGCTRRPGPLRLHRVIGVDRSGLPASGFPGISPRQQLGFLYIDRKDNSK